MKTLGAGHFRQRLLHYHSTHTFGQDDTGSRGSQCSHYLPVEIPAAELHARRKHLIQIQAVSEHRLP